MRLVAGCIGRVGSRHPEQRLCASLGASLRRHPFFVKCALQVGCMEEKAQWEIGGIYEIWCHAACNTRECAFGRKCLILMVPRGGIEPPTRGFSERVYSAPPYAMLTKTLVPPRIFGLPCTTLLHHGIPPFRGEK